MQTKVYIDANSSILYGSFYVEGLKIIFGNKNVSFSNKYFNDGYSVGWNIRFVIVSKNSEKKKYFIHTNDTYVIDKNMYDWCDVYGHVNANFKHLPKEEYPKVVSLVPSFGINIFGKYESIYVALITLLKSYKTILGRTEWNKYKEKSEVSILKNVKHHFGRIIKNNRNRPKYSDYSKEVEVRDNYVFFQSTLWYSDEHNQNDEKVNKRRLDFIRAVKQNNAIEFEGGLLADSTSSIEKFKDVVTFTRLSMSEWLTKTKESMVVFNTPAFWDCHGWKLGEYLALGKCIISTPLSNDLPAPLEHGKQIHYVNSYEDMCEAVEYIRRNPDYRVKLENGAREYWDKYGTPIKALGLLGINKV